MVTDVSSAPDGIESRCGPMSSTPPRGPIVWDAESGERGAQRSRAVPGASGSSTSGSSGTPVGARSPQPTSAAMNRRRVAFMDDRRAWESWQTVLTTAATSRPATPRPQGAPLAMRGRHAPVDLSRPRLGGIHTQQPIDRALPRAGGLERTNGDDDPSDQAPVALVHDRQPGVEHREDQQGVAEGRGPVLEAAHREQNADVHHCGAHDPGQKAQGLEESVERRQAADDCEHAGDLAGARIEGADVDTRLRHSGTSAGESFPLYASRGPGKVAPAPFAR